MRSFIELDFHELIRFHREQTFDQHGVRRVRTQRDTNRSTEHTDRVLGFREKMGDRFWHRKRGVYVFKRAFAAYSGGPHLEKDVFLGYSSMGYMP